MALTPLFTSTASSRSCHSEAYSLHLFPAPAFLLALPGLGAGLNFLGLPPAGPPDFIFLALNPLTSPDERASLDLAYFFLPPKPNLASFRCLLALGPPPSLPSRPRFLLLLPLGPPLSSLSTATSKRSSASLAPVGPPPSLRSV